MHVYFLTCNNNKAAPSSDWQRVSSHSHAPNQRYNMRNGSFQIYWTVLAEYTDRHKETCRRLARCVSPIARATKSQSDPLQVHFAQPCKLCKVLISENIQIGMIKSLPFSELNNEVCYQLCND